MKITKNILSFIKKYYVNGNSISEIKNILLRDYGLKISFEAIRKRLIKDGVKLRTSKEATLLFYRKSMPVNEIIVQYSEYKKSIRNLSREFKMTRQTIKKVLSEKDILIRGNDDAIRLSNLKHRRQDISDIYEKAYMTGLTIGDLGVKKKSKYTLRLATNSTHKTFIDLLSNVFSKYGKVHIYPSFDGISFQWSFYIDVELNYFDFLLEAKSSNLIPKVVDKNNFMYFLAGLIDSDGSLLFKKTNNNFQLAIRIFSQNAALLQNIKQILSSHGITSGISKTFKAGRTTIFKGKKFVYNKDYYTLEISKRSDVIKLIGFIPLKHPEKISKKLLFLQIEKKGLTTWDGIKNEVIEIRNDINEELLKSVSLATKLYNNRRSNL